MATIATAAERSNISGNNLEFKGVFPANPTPVDSDGRINEKALEKIGKSIENLDEIRSLFLNHPVEDFIPEWKSPDFKSTISFLCENYSFNRPRVEKALDKYVQENPTARQLTLGDF